MECEVCREKLADFLLDELPESEAVLVQEHLALCQTCQATYKELKGTGRALEAVPAMRPVQPSTNFSSQVMRAARAESEKILNEMPTERRIRLQQRRKARQTRQQPTQEPAPKSSAWRGALLLLLAGGIALVAILLYYRRSTPNEAVVIGTLSNASGRVEQFRPQGGTQYTAVKPGQGIRSGDEFLNDDAGRARLTLKSGNVFLGPQARVRFLPSMQENAPQLRLLKGEVALERGLEGAELADWILECGAWRVRIPPATRARFLVNPELPSAPPALHVLTGAVHVGLPGRMEEAKVTEGQQAVLSGDAPSIKPGAQWPAWRADLCDEKELSSVLNGLAKVVACHPKGLLVELNYGLGQSKRTGDWRCEKDPIADDGGLLRFPNRARCVLNAPLAAPLTVEATVNANVPKECPWSVSLLSGEAGRITLDLGNEAVLSVQTKPVPRVARLGYRATPQTAERVRVEVKEDGEGEALLAIGAEKAQPLPVPQKMLDGGEVRIEVMGEGLVLDGLRIRGVLPREWLLKMLQAAK